MKKLLLLTGLFLALFSCEKETFPDQRAELAERLLATGGPAVYAGIVKPGILVQDFNPPLEITLQWDAQNLYGSGSISLDLDQDTNTDFDLYMNVLNYDSIHLLNGGLPDPFPACRLTRYGDWETSFLEMPYPVGLGTTAYAYYVKAFKPNQKINAQSVQWSGEYLSLWQETPSTFQPPAGPWRSSEQIAYIGVLKRGARLWDKTYGWIEIDKSEANNPKVLRIAVEDN